MTLAAIILGGLIALVSAYSWAAYYVAGWGRPKGCSRWRFEDWARHHAPWYTKAQHHDSGIYVFWCFCFPIYVGQAVDLARRIDQHGFDVRQWMATHVTSYVCPENMLDSDEWNLIHAYPWTLLLKENRTEGNR